MINKYILSVIIGVTFLAGVGASYIIIQSSTPFMSQQHIQQMIDEPQIKQQMMDNMMQHQSMMSSMMQNKQMMDMMGSSTPMMKQQNRDHVGMILQDPELKLLCIDHLSQC